MPSVRRWSRHTPTRFRMLLCPSEEDIERVPCIPRCWCPVIGSILLRTQSFNHLLESRNRLRCNLSMQQGMRCFTYDSVALAVVVGHIQLCFVCPADGDCSALSVVRYQAFPVVIVVQVYPIAHATSLPRNSTARSIASYPVPSRKLIVLQRITIQPCNCASLIFSLSLATMLIER